MHMWIIIIVGARSAARQHTQNRKCGEPDPDLCVDVAWQRRGVGRALVAATKRAIGPGCNVLLLSVPNAMTDYPQIGMERADNAFLIRRDR